MIRSTIVLALVALCVAQNAPSSDNEGKLFFGSFGTRTTILLQTSTLIRYTTCTLANADTADCTGRRKKRFAAIAMKEADGESKASVDSSLNNQDEVSSDKEGKLGFFNTVTTTLMVTTTSINPDITVSLRRLCNTNPNFRPTDFPAC